MRKRILAFLLSVAMLFTAAAPVFASTPVSSKQDLLDLVQRETDGEALEFPAVGVSGNELTRADTIWFWFDTNTFIGYAYLLVESGNNNKVAIGAELGGVYSDDIYYYEGSGNVHSWSLIKFSDIFFEGDASLKVDMGSGGNNIDYEKIHGPFEFNHVRYYDNEGLTLYASDPFKPGMSIQIKDSGYFNLSKLGYKFVGWGSKPGATEADPAFAPGKSTNVSVDLYAVWEKDPTVTKELSYKVEYYLDDDEAPFKTDVFTKEVWVNDPATIHVESVDEVKYLPYGYKFDRVDTVLPADIGNGEAIKVYYVPDYDLTKELKFTVEYYKDNDLFGSDEIKVNAWVNAPDVIRVEAVETEKNKPAGYKVGSIDPELPANVNNGGVVKVYYVPDYTVTKDLTYTVEYYIDDGEEDDGEEDGDVDEEEPFATEEVTVKVWVNAKTALVTEVDTETYLPNGYKLGEIDPELPADIEDGGVIKVFYVPDYTVTKDLTYTVEYYVENGKEEDDDDDDGEADGDVDEEEPFATEEITVKVWVNAKTARVTEVETQTYQPDGYKVGKIAPELPADIEDGGVIRVYYIPGDDTAYIIEHCDEVSGALIKSEVRSGTTGATATAEPKEIDGYTFNEGNENNLTSGKIAGDGSLVLRLYYKPDRIVITADSASKRYDGTALTAKGYKVSAKLPVGVTEVTAVTAGSQTAIGTSANIIESYKLFNDGVDVTELYLDYVDLVPGTLTVTRVSSSSSSSSGRGRSIPDSIAPAGPPTQIVEVIKERPTPLAAFIPEHIQYVNGYPDGSVRPGKYITRAEVSAILFRLLVDSAKYESYTSDYSDVKDDAWYAQSVKYLTAVDIARGYEEGDFRPDRPISRAEFAAMISGFDKLEETDGDRFSDIDDHWAAGYINSAAQKGWVTGHTDGTFRPEDYMSRAEVVTVINRMLLRGIEADDIPNWAPSYNDINEYDWAYTAMIEASCGHEFGRKPHNDGINELWTGELTFVPVLES